ncbi:unnamed protein product [Cunninghamella echinulata]
MSVWQSGRLKCQQLFSTTTRSSNKYKKKNNRFISDDSFTSSSTSSSTFESESSSYSTSTSTSRPENHPPPHVFGYSEQGYSIFYRKLSNGNYIVRVRTADRKIIASYEVEGCMI